MRLCSNHHIGPGITFQMVWLAITRLGGFLVDVFQQAFAGVKDAAVAGDHVLAGRDFIDAGEGATRQGQGNASG